MSRRHTIATLVPAALLAVLAGTGCKDDPYCLTCGDGGRDAAPDAPMDAMPDGSDAATDAAGDASSEGGFVDGGCLDRELCNDRDDDCDGLVDEGIDTDVDPNNCGGCGEICSPAHAFPLCEDGVCKIGSCDVEWQDLDGELSNGCEYRCTPTADDDSSCDLRDNDCDGETDEDVDLDTDVDNCGSCGRACVFANAEATCVAGDCELGTCNAGFQDLNGRDLDGCEYSCTPADPAEETCNNVDDDCDGEVDEGLTQECGSDVGACSTGTETCFSGEWVGCDAVLGSSETCDNVDNDCDGETDEGLTRSCGISTGECSVGTETCNAGAWEGCTATTGTDEVCDARDNDCDGDTDEGLTQGCSSACGTGTATCIGGVYKNCDAPAPETETCNGVDDDCDGTIDEGLTRSCGTNVGQCSVGTETCNAGAWEGCTATTGTAEVCDALDNDCDGSTDEGVTQSCSTACGTGTETCSGGVFVGCDAPAPQPETCDGVDNDCDGTIDEGLTRSCGTNVGECSVGTETCDAGAWVGCTADTGGAEVCDALDNDCDGSIDEGLTRSCSTDCGTGTETCSSGVWAGCDAPLPQTEVCDGADNDCDGSVDETFDLTSDINNCGFCGNTCSFPNGFATCSSSSCVLTGCQSGYHDNDGDPSNGCEYSCSVAGSEVCNGLDDDCDCDISVDPDCDTFIDEDLSPPSNFCNPNGVCAGTTATCGGSDSWTCTYPAEFEESETSCDGLDNDCDGSTDEPFPRVGTSCSFGEGECRSTGVYECNSTGDGVVCNAPPAGSPSDEVCDNLDNDCDGLIDERTADDPGTSWRDGIDLSAIATVTVDRPGGGTMEIMQYEASRPDADSTSGGSVAEFACSKPNVVPWTNVSWPEARDACCALNPDGTCPGSTETGWRLCPAPDWQAACEGPSATACTWSYASSCTMSQPTVCNGNEHDCDPSLAGDQDCLYTTGSPTFPECRTDWSTGGVYDMSGNVKEWTSTEADTGIYEVRGGAYTSIEQGRRCDFDFTVIPQDEAHPNMGFRCCYY